MRSVETVFRQYLKEKGMLVSRQREQVLAAFIEAKNHPTVDDIYNTIRKKSEDRTCYCLSNNEGNM